MNPEQLAALLNLLERYVIAVVRDSRSDHIEDAIDRMNAREEIEKYITANFGVKE